MAASQESITTTASRWAPVTGRGRHILEVTSYSLGLALGEFIDSSFFTVGGHGWCICYRPDGVDGYKDYASVFLYLRSKTTSKVRVLYDFRLLNPATGVFSSVRAGTCVLDSQWPTSDTKDFMKRSELEAYLRNDLLVIGCDLTVILGEPVSKSRRMFEIQVPPSDVLHNLGKLLESAEGADVTFKVQDEVFHAHKIVLTMRSPVFKAELVGPMSDKICSLLSSRRCFTSFTTIRCLQWTILTEVRKKIWLSICLWLRTSMPWKG